jgi:DNA-binding PadR family transcriptional regulator
MSLKHALLGFLNYGPHTGYELKKVFDISVAHFWNAELSQIYPSLKALETEGLVEMNVDVQEDRPNRKVYSITDDGRRELIEWLSTPADSDQVREPLLVKLFFGSSLPKRDLLAVLYKRADDLRSTVAKGQQGSEAVRGLARVIGLEREGLFWELTMDAELKHSEAALEWTEEAIRRLQATDDDAFDSHPSDFATMDTKSRVEILDKLKGAVAPAVHAVHHFE